MKTIYKYELRVDDEQRIRLPRGSELLSVGVQRGKLYLWARVNPNNENTPYDFIIHGTGHPADDVDGMDFLGTFQLHGGDFVGHCFGIEL